MKYQVLEISEEMKAKANKEGLHKNLRNSIRGKDNALVARLGEMIALFFTKGELVNTFDYDIVSENGIKVDVKTKERTVDPKPFYEVSVADYNTTQKCDCYMFVTINTKAKPIRASVVGWKWKDDFYKSATFHQKGQIDNNNGFIFRADCYNMKFEELTTDVSPLLI